MLGHKNRLLVLAGKHSLSIGQLSSKAWSVCKTFYSILNIFSVLKKKILKQSVLTVQEFHSLWADTSWSHTKPCSFIFASRSSTLSIFIPACLTGGSSTLSISILGAMSIPRSAGDFLSSFFFLAFCKESQGICELQCTNLIHMFF